MWYAFLADRTQLLKNVNLGFDQARYAVDAVLLEVTWLRGQLAEAEDNKADLVGQLAKAKDDNADIARQLSALSQENADLRGQLGNVMERDLSILKLANAVKEKLDGQLARAEAYIYHLEARIRWMSQTQTLEEQDTVAGAKDPLAGVAGPSKQPKSNAAAGSKGEMDTVAGAEDPLGGGLAGHSKQVKGKAGGITSTNGSTKSGGVSTITIEH